MNARLLDGTAVAAAIREELRTRVERFTRATGRPPALGIVLVGSHPASEIYVRNKRRAGELLGVAVDLVRLPESSPLEAVLRAVDRLNCSDAHDGVLVQAPLPASAGPDAMARVVDTIDPAKDVDGFHPLNVGGLVQGRATFAPCTPSGILALLDRSGIPIAGRRAVVLGRSDIVGKPVALLLLRRHATVTICHSKTPDLAATSAIADILVAAIGRPALVTREFVKPGAAVIDVGINRVTDEASVHAWFPTGSARRAEFDRQGSILVGDVHPEVAEVAGALTPVPGGVGPLTVAMLMVNTLQAAEMRLQARRATSSKSAR